MSFFNPGKLVFKTKLRHDGWNASAVTVLDINHDGHLDIITGRIIQPATNNPVPLEIMLGNGDGTFRLGNSVITGTMPSVIGPHRSLVADFNGDGKPDVFIATYGPDIDQTPGEHNVLLLSHGNKLEVASASNLPDISDASHGTATGDIDGDGDLDIYVANGPGSLNDYPSYFLINNGHGKFTMDTTRVPVDFSDHDGPTSISVGMADFDKDGDSDLWLGANNDPDGNAVLKNDGTGHFTLGSRVAQHGREASDAVFVTTADIDGDGLPDVIQSEGGDGYRHLAIYSNKGGLHFVDETSTRLYGFDAHLDLPFEGINLTRLADVNGDGAQDIVVEFNFDDYQVLLNNGDGVFFAPKDGKVPNEKGAVAVGDFNEDGHPDLVGFLTSAGAPADAYLYAWAHQPTYALAGTGKSDRLFGDARSNKMTGGNGSDTILSGAGNDKVSGNNNNDRIDGGSGKDTLDGGNGNDTLTGGAGKDSLAGGTGNDVFVFNAKLGSSNVDTIADFKHNHDVIRLDNDVMANIGAKGHLDGALFYAHHGATQGAQSDDRIVYDTTSGKLYYDSNGSAAGGVHQIAILTGHPTLDAGDFEII